MEIAALPLNDDASDLMQGTLAMLILRSLSDGAKHGYAVADFIRRRSDGVLRVKEGALYPALHRLETHGWVGSEWGFSENKRRAKFYRLTAAGAKELTANGARWSRVTTAIAKVMETP